MSATPEPKPAPTADESSHNMRELEAYRRGLVDGARFAAIDFRRLIEEETEKFRKIWQAGKPS